jgi:hypothetical protein
MAGRPGTGVFLDNLYEDGAAEGSVRLEKAGRAPATGKLDTALRGFPTLRIRRLPKSR